MAKRSAKATKKKRNKRYTGDDAAVRGTKVTRIVATKKSPLQEFWSERKGVIIGYSALTALIVAVGSGLFFFISWIF